MDKKKEVIKKSLNILEELMDTSEDGGFEAIAALLKLPEEQFEIISGPFLLELERQIRRTENLNQIVSTYVQNGVTAKDLEKICANTLEEVDDRLSDMDIPKRDYIKNIISLIYNISIEALDDEKPIIIPLEKMETAEKIPTYAHFTDAGADIYALEDITIKPGETTLLKTGIKVAVPYGYEIQVRPKSGISLKTKLRIANTPGTIDSGYRDEIGIIVENVEPPIKDITFDYNEEKKYLDITSILYGSSYTISKGQKIAQLVLNKISKMTFMPVSNIKEVEGDRGGGFGSTGLK